MQFKKLPLQHNKKNKDILSYNTIKCLSSHAM